MNNVKDGNSAHVVVVPEFADRPKRWYLVGDVDAIAMDGDLPSG